MREGEFYEQIEQTIPTQEQEQEQQEQKPTTPEYFSGRETLNTNIQHIFDTDEDKILSSTTQKEFTTLIGELAPGERRKMIKELESIQNSPPELKNKIYGIIDSYLKKEIKVTEENVEISLSTLRNNLSLDTSSKEKIENNNIKLKKEETNKIIQEQNEKIHKVEQTEETIKIIEAFKETNIAKEKLNIQITPEQQQQAQEKLKNNGTLSQLQKNNLSQDQINDYIVFTATQDLLASKQVQVDEKDSFEFLMSFKNLNNELNIPDSSSESFSPKNIHKTTKTLFHPEIGNKNLITTLEENKNNHHSKDYEELFNSQNTKEEQVIKEKFINNLSGDQKYLYQQLSQKLENNQRKIGQEREEITEQEQLFLQSIEQKRQETKIQFQEQLKTTMEQIHLMGPVMGISNYLNKDTGKNFQFNKSNDIQLQQGILTMKGNINGKIFSIRSDLSKPSPLQTNDYLSQEAENQFNIGQENFQNTKYILPSQQEIWSTIKETYQEQQLKLREHCSDFNEYPQLLQENLQQQVLKLYGNKELVQIRMEKQMQKDLVAQETITMFNEYIFDGEEKLPQSINANNQSSQELISFLKRFDTFLENASPEEMNLWKQNIKGLCLMLRNTKSNKNKNNAEPLKNFSLQHIENSKTILRGGENIKPHIFELLSPLIQEGKETDTNLMNEFSHLLRENQNEKPDSRKYQTLQDNREKENVDKNLENNELWN